MRVARLETAGFRNLERSDVEIPAGLTLIHGPNGAGKTNLMEALYFGLTGRSCRTNTKREMIGFGMDMARAEVEVEHGSAVHKFLAATSRSQGHRYTLDGSPLEGASTLRPAVAVFMPDRLSLIKGAPSLRRAHLDNLVAALWPARTTGRRRYREALAQRNALLSRTGPGETDRLDPWDRELANRAVELMKDRAQAIDAIASMFTEWSERLGLGGEVSITYSPRSKYEEADGIYGELVGRRRSDIDRGFTGYGPHLDEVKIDRAGRALRRYGSQGQQRAALLALLFAERQALLAEHGRSPLMLLDDVLSELDPDRRALLADALDGGGQALITATERDHLPGGGDVTAIRVQGGVVEGESVPS